MKRRLLFALISSLIAVNLVSISGNSCFSQGITMEKTHGPYGGRVFQIAVDPKGTIVAGVENCGIFRSTDDGSSWQPTSQSDETIVAMTVDRHGHFLGGSYSGGGVFISSDAGLTWSMSNTGLSNDEVLSFAITPVNHIFVGTFDDGVFRSTDDGMNWTRLQLPVNGDAIYPVRSVCADSSGHVFAGVGGKGLYRSSNDGESWTQVGSPGTEIHSLICPAPGEILAGINYGVYRSTDAGATWNQLGGALPNINSIRTNQAGHIFAFTDSGLYRSNNGGLSWAGLNVGLRARRFLSGAISPIGTIYAGSDGDGIARSTDNGATWEETNTGITGTSVWSVLQTASGSMLAATERGLWASSDKGTSWTLTAVLPRPIQSLAANHKGLLFAATSSGLYRSSNNGLNWIRVDRNFTWSYMTAVSADSSGTVFVGTSLGQLYRSTDSGDTWTQVLNAGSRFTSISSSGAGEVFAGTEFISLFHSTDRGVSWAQIDNGLTDAFGGRTIFSVSVLRIGDVYAGGSGGRLLRSTDRGLSWVTLLDDAGIIWSLVEDGNGVLYAGTSTGVFTSSNLGFSWQTSHRSFINNSAHSLCFDNEGYLYAGLVYGGILRSNQQVHVEIPSSPQVSQNYPNPFNASTIIEFSLLAAAEVDLRIYNVLGQEVTTLVSDELSAGRHAVRWNSHVSSGVYFYRLKTGEHGETKRMILLK